MRPQRKIITMQELPKVLSLRKESVTDARYDNHAIAAVNDHAVRISVMTEAYHWHTHPASDEAFLVVEGTLEIEFEQGSVQINAGELVTVPKGVRHRTRPVGARSVNITFELASSTTEPA